MRLIVVCFVMIGLLLGAEFALSDVYKWVDEEGVTHFSDKKSAAPHATESFRPEPLNSFESTSVGEASSRFNNKVELYTTSWCPYCEKSREYFRDQGVAFKEYDIEKDASAAARKKRLGSRRGVPFAVVNGEKIQGYSVKKYAQALRSSN